MARNPRGQGFRPHTLLLSLLSRHLGETLNPRLFVIFESSRTTTTHKHNVEHLLLHGFVRGTNVFSFLSQNVMEQFNPGLRNLINLGKNYEKSVAGEFFFLSLNLTQYKLLLVTLSFLASV